MNAIVPDMRYTMLAAPAVLAFADDPAERRGLCHAIAAAGGRLVADGSSRTDRLPTPFRGSIGRSDRVRWW